MPNYTVDSIVIDQRIHSSGNILMQDAFLPARSTYEICVLKINSILTISSC